ncbi:MAG: YbaB/EbfC family nucleoid-associated protein [Lentisphaeria bacterium]|nr:YbaB/EbfC family nucleoid-associated protein [Lentisphaeria bacterium]
MFGNLGEMAKLMQKAKDIQNNMKKMKQEMAESEYEASAPGGQVRAVVSGDFQLKAITIAPEAMNNRELLEDQVLCAVRSALDNARNAAQARMAEVTGGLNIPGLF